MDTTTTNLNKTPTQKKINRNVYEILSDHLTIIPKQKKKKKKKKKIDVRNVNIEILQNYKNHMGNGTNG